ncbi:MAG: acyltransferase, partial [Burkholderiales bacterium]
GYLGVDFFFILSGFIIALSSERLLERSEGIKAYASARMVRIYVPYLPVGIGVYLLYLLLPGLSATDRVPGALTSFTLLPTELPPALSVAWTLVHEMIFYAVFSLIFLSRAALWTVLLIWAAAISFAWATKLQFTRFESYFLSPLNLYFLTGVSLFYVSKYWKASTPLSAGAFVAGGLAVVVGASFQEAFRLLAAAGFTLIVFGASSSWGTRMKIWRLPAVLGAASYAIYLVHNPALSIFVRLARWAHLDALALPVIAAAATLAGIAYWAIYERHALKFARQLVKRL